MRPASSSGDESEDYSSDSSTGAEMNANVRDAGCEECWCRRGVCVCDGCWMSGVLV